MVSWHFHPVRRLSALCVEHVFKLLYWHLNQLQDETIHSKMTMHPTTKYVLKVRHTIYTVSCAIQWCRCIHVYYKYWKCIFSFQMYFAVHKGLKVLKLLNTKKGHGPDLIDPYFLKIAADFIAELLTNTFNLTLLDNEIPKILEGLINAQPKGFFFLDSCSFF